MIFFIENTDYHILWLNVSLVGPLNTVPKLKNSILIFMIFPIINRAFNIFQLYQCFTIYRRYFLLKIWTLFMNTLSNTLNWGGTKDHFRQVKVPGTVPYWKACINTDWHVIYSINVILEHFSYAWEHHSETVVNYLSTPQWHYFYDMFDEEIHPSVHELFDYILSTIF